MSARLQAADLAIASEGQYELAAPANSSRPPIEIAYGDTRIRCTALIDVTVGMPRLRRASSAAEEAGTPALRHVVQCINVSDARLSAVDSPDGAAFRSLLALARSLIQSGLTPPATGIGASRVSCRDARPSDTFVSCTHLLHRFGPTRDRTRIIIQYARHKLPRNNHARDQPSM